MSKGGEDIKRVFYWGSGSPPCIRAMIALYEKGVGDEFTKKLLSFEAKDHKTPEMLKLNRRGQLPVLELGNGDVICESAAICDYLERKYPGKGTNLLPDDPKVFQKRAEIEANIPTKLIQLFPFYMRATEEQREEKSFQEELTKKLGDLRDELKIWEGYMKENGDGAYIVGKEFTMADVFLMSNLMIFVRFGMDISKFPCLKAYYDRVKERKSIQEAWPPHWKNTENTKMLPLKNL